MQGSNCIVPLGEHLYSGPFLDANQITEQLQRVCAAKFPDHIRFGCRLSKNLEISLAPQKFCNWTLAENQLIKVEVDRNNVKRLEKVMYAYVNKKSDFRHRPGQYKTWFLPDKARMLPGSQGALACIKTLCKHAAIIKSLTLIKTKDIKSLDDTVTFMVRFTPFNPFSSN